MANAAAVLIHISVLLVTGLVVGLAYCRDRQRPIIRCFLFLGAMSICWTICAMFYFVSSTSLLTRYLNNLRFAFVGFSILALIVFVLYFYRLDHYIRPPVIVILSVFPLITAAVAFTSPWHQLLGGLSLEPLQAGSVHRGDWYWVHATYSYLVMALTVLIAVAQHIKLPKSRRTSSLLLVGGVTVTFFCSLLTVMGLVAYPFSLTPISMGISLVLFYFALCNSSKMDILMLARNEIFDLIDDAVFVLDTEDKVMDINQSGRNWLIQLGITGALPTYRDIINSLKQSGAEFQRVENWEPGTDVSINSPQGTMVYNIREKRIAGEDGHELGMLITCNDVTRNRQLIHRLEAAMEIDALTGLQNRWGLYRMFARIVEEQVQPVTLIMGDVNGLKVINDNCGHQMGDLLLRETAHALKKHCPELGETFRVGGDEFVLLLPGCDDYSAQQLIRDIHQSLESIHHLPFPVSISLGFATDSTSSSLEDLMRRADDSMYRSKRMVYHRTRTNDNSMLI